METKANYILVGVFALLTIVVGFAFIYWEMTSTQGIGTAALRIEIPGSAAGLDKGSPVTFNGVRVGDVTRLAIDPARPAVALVDIVVDRETPIRASTKAAMSFTGLTGSAGIAFSGGAANEPNLLDEAEKAGETLVIVAEPSGLADIMDTAREVLARADKATAGIEQLVADVREPLTKTAANAEKLSDTLARNADNIDKFLASAGKLSDQLGGISTELETTLKEARELLDAVDKEKVKTIVGSVESTMKRIDEASVGIDKVVKGVDEAAASVKTFANDAGASFEKIERLVSDVDPAVVKKAVDDIAAVSDNARKASEDIVKVTGKVGDKAKDIEQIITDARELADRLNKASTRVDGVLAKVDSLLGSDDANGLAAQAKGTLASYRQLADTLNGRAGAIADGLARFSGQGLRDFEALVRDGRRSVSRIEQAITDLERNPQRILSGGQGEVRTYSGRNRR
ncbi:MAG: MCE family protein [Phyllobacteriaceae bacterium]|nr:MCE family protein [Phyllobacteriaceae bacterium]